MSTLNVVTVENKKLFYAEVAILFALFVLDFYGYVPVSKTLFLFALGWASLRMRGFTWRDVGFAAPSNWGKAIGIGLAVGAAMSALELLVTRPLLVSAIGTPPDLADLAPIRGDAGAFALTLAFIWVLAAFGEELVYRGYLMTRFARLLAGESAGWMMSLVVVSLIFGFGHMDQGTTGMVENVINGLLLGALYLATGRNLVAPIVAHGVASTIDLTLIFLGRYPGM
jgi:membrane protease YdiL (CAAX protease family)